MVDVGPDVDSHALVTQAGALGADAALRDVPLGWSSAGRSVASPVAGGRPVVPDDSAAGRSAADRPRRQRREGAGPCGRRLWPTHHRPAGRAGFSGRRRRTSARPAPSSPAGREGGGTPGRRALSARLLVRSPARGLSRWLPAAPGLGGVGTSPPEVTGWYPSLSEEYQPVIAGGVVDAPTPRARRRGAGLARRHRRSGTSRAGPPWATTLWIRARPAACEPGCGAAACAPRWRRRQRAGRPPRWRPRGPWRRHRRRRSRRRGRRARARLRGAWWSSVRVRRRSAQRSRRSWSAPPTGGATAVGPTSCAGERPECPTTAGAPTGRLSSGVARQVGYTMSRLPAGAPRKPAPSTSPWLGFGVALRES